MGLKVGNQLRVVFFFFTLFSSNYEIIWAINKYCQHLIREWLWLYEVQGSWPDLWSLGKPAPLCSLGCALLISFASHIGPSPGSLGFTARCYCTWVFVLGFIILSRIKILEKVFTFCSNNIFCLTVLPANLCSTWHCLEQEPPVYWCAPRVELILEYQHCW